MNMNIGLYMVIAVAVAAVVGYALTHSASKTARERKKKRHDALYTEYLWECTDRYGRELGPKGTIVPIIVLETYGTRQEKQLFLAQFGKEIQKGSLVRLRLRRKGDFAGVATHIFPHGEHLVAELAEPGAALLERLVRPRFGGAFSTLRIQAIFMSHRL